MALADGYLMLATTEGRKEYAKLTIILKAGKNRAKKVRFRVSIVYRMGGSAVRRADMEGRSDGGSYCRRIDGSGDDLRRHVGSHKEEGGADHPGAYGGDRGGEP